MAYRLAADLTLILHLSFIAYVLLGGLLCIKRQRWVWLHLPSLAWGLWVEWSGVICPLTPLENHFRRLAGLQGYRESFIDQYLMPLIYPEMVNFLTPWILNMILVSVNFLVYLLAFRKWREISLSG